MELNPFDIDLEVRYLVTTLKNRCKNFLAKKIEGLKSDLNIILVLFLSEL